MHKNRPTTLANEAHSHTETNNVNLLAGWWRLNVAPNTTTEKWWQTVQLHSQPCHGKLSQSSTVNTSLNLHLQSCLGTLPPSDLSMVTPELSKSSGSGQAHTLSLLVSLIFFNEASKNLAFQLLCVCACRVLDCVCVCYLRPRLPLSLSGFINASHLDMPSSQLEGVLVLSNPLKPSQAGTTAKQQSFTDHDY